MSVEHPVEQPIEAIVICLASEGVNSESYRIGYDGVTRIEACTKSGMYADIPYVRVWRGGSALSEFCQHNIVEVVFKQPPKFAETSCSHCGRTFGPGDHGFSHCDEHKHLGRGRP